MSTPAEYAEAVGLGVLQGVAEFLPVSSSGHLVIARAVLDAAAGREPTAADEEAGRLLVVVLHLGTLGSILWAYRRELLNLATDFKYLACVTLATLPLVGVALSPLKDTLEESFASPAVAGACLLLTAALLLAGQWLARGRETVVALAGKGRPATAGTVGLPQAAAVGAFQCLALLPGVSRSGSTIEGALATGVGRENAVRFSLMVGVPAIAGAGLLEAKDVWERGVGSAPVGPLLVGAAVSFAVGVGAISLLRAAVTRDRLHWFALYCGLVGTATLAWRLGLA